MGQEESDSALKGDLKSWVATTNNEDTNTLTKAILFAVIFVAEHLVQQKATYFQLSVEFSFIDTVMLSWIVVSALIPLI